MTLSARLLLIACAGLLLASACETDCNAVEPAYGGEGNDEAWRVLLDGRARAEESSDVEITSPGADEALAKDEPATIAWTTTLQVAALSPSLSPSLPPSLSTPRSRRPVPGLFDKLSSLVFPVAHAHLPPITSDVYFLEIDVPGRTCPVAAVTTGASFAFSADDWAEVAVEPGERTLRLLGAFLTENRITEGPFQASPVTFTIE